MTTCLLDGWAALGDPTRRTIFARVTAAPRAVGELADTMPVSRPAVSQHLKILKDAGLVLDERAGSRRIYRVNPEGPPPSAGTMTGRLPSGHHLGID